ncbi:GGDEF domain-containing protein [Candidatus Poribacteria bacterium]|nr:GGDEF domain-containing protein [Candidatus Poribacteria bacterium]
MANLLTGTISRGSDLVARYGGEEFAVVLANTGAEDAAFLAEKLRSRVEALSVLHKNSPISTCITISVGVATMQLNQNDSPDSLTAAADVALYEAKGAGRNCVKSACSFEGNDPKRRCQIVQSIRPSLSM